MFYFLKGNFEEKSFIILKMIFVTEGFVKVREVLKVVGLGGFRQSFYVVLVFLGWGIWEDQVVGGGFMEMFIRGEFAIFG